MRLYLHSTILRSTAALRTAPFLKQQCRSMTLCMALNPKKKYFPEIKLTGFQSYKFPDPSSYTLEIWQDKPRRSLGTKDLASALREHGGAGLVLHQIGQRKPTKSSGTVLGEYIHKSADERLSVHNTQQSLERPRVKTQDAPRFIFKPLALKEDSKKQTHGMYKKLRFYLSVENTPSYAATIAKASELLTKQKAVEFIIFPSVTETLENALRRYPQLHCDSILAALPTGCYFVVQPQIRSGAIHFLVGPPGKNVFSEDGTPHDLTNKLHETMRKAMDKAAEKKDTLPRKTPSHTLNTRASKSGEEGAGARNTRQGREHETTSDNGDSPGVKVRRFGNSHSTIRQQGGELITRLGPILGNNSPSFVPKQWWVRRPSYSSPRTSRLSLDGRKEKFSREAQFNGTSRDRVQRDGPEKAPRELKIRLVGTADPNYRPLPEGEGLILKASEGSKSINTHTEEDASLLGQY